ncbi:MAG: acyltransferase [Acidobacteriaceae bacterium]
MTTLSPILDLAPTLPAAAERPAPATRPARKPPLPALSGIRTLLAVFILFFHFTPPHVDFLHPIIDNSFIFVGTFFLISGFILTYNYDERATTLSKRDFWLARFARLYPTYIFVLLLSTPLLFIEWQGRPHTEFWTGLLVTPLLLQGWSPSLATFWNTVAWTLSADLLLYLIFPYVLQIWALRGAALNTPRRLIGIILVLWLIGIAPHTYYHFVNPDHLSAPADRFTGTVWMRVLKYTPLAYLCTFLVGLTLAKLHALVTLTPSRRLLLCASSLLVILTFFYLGAPHVPYVIIHGALLLPFFCLLVLGLTGPNPIASIFAFRPLVILGETTFALYLLHFNVFELIHNYHLPERLHVVALDPWISYVTIILLAYATVRFIEKPAQRMLLRRFGRKPAPAAAPTLS